MACGGPHWVVGLMWPISPGIGTYHKLHHNTHIAKDCKLAPVTAFMPRLDYVLIYLEAGVMTRLGEPGW